METLSTLSSQPNPKLNSSSNSTSNSTPNSIPRLSKDQIQFFWENGYLLVKDFIPQNQIKELKTYLSNDLIPSIYSKTKNDLEKLGVFSTSDDQQRDQYFMQSGDSISPFLERGAVDSSNKLLEKYKSETTFHGAINKIGHTLHRDVPMINKFCTQSLFKTLLHDLGYTKPTCPQSMYILKNGHVGGSVEPHQDETFLYTFGKENPIPQSLHFNQEKATKFPVIGLWMPLEPATLDNGCLHAYPKSHGKLYSRYLKTHSGLKSFPSPISTLNSKLNSQKSFKKSSITVTAENSKGTAMTFMDSPIPIPKEYLDINNYVAVECNPSDLFLIHGRIFHASKANKSSKSRQAFVFHCIESTNEYPGDNWLTSQKPFVSIY